jgi:hypothetical protein
LLLLASACREPAPPPPPAASPPISRQALIAGQIPADREETALLHSRCAICHSLEYVTQQRLTPNQWEKTVLKMQKWGAPISEAEAATLGRFLAAHWTPDLPERSSAHVAAPASALPAEASP